jgi:plasmid stabilization system protein ParE
MPIHPAPRLPMFLVVTAASLVGAMTAALGAAPVPTAGATTHPAAVARERERVDAATRMPSAARRASAPTMTDADLDGLVAMLDALPDDIKAANPRTTPDCERRLGRAIDRLTESPRAGSSTRPSESEDALSMIGAGHAVEATDLRGSAPTVRLAVGWVACAASVAGVIAQYGLPVSKVVSSIREARALFGSAYDIYVAIRYGRAAAEMGEEATRLIEALLGIDGVVSACSGAAATDV